jgi:hypothetical protein
MFPPERPDWTPEPTAEALRSLQAICSMSERDWELYRLSVVESMPDSPYKMAVIEGIRHKMEMLERFHAFGGGVAGNSGRG